MPRTPRARLAAPSILLALFACVSAPRPAASSATAAVYTAAFRASIGSDRPGGTRIEEQAASLTLPTLGTNTRPGVREEMADMPADLLARLAAIGDSGRSTRTFSLPPATHVVTRAESLRLQEAGLGGESVLGVSSVAFSDDSARAVVYVERHCGPVCGDGTVYSLVRDTRGRWDVRGRLTLWQG